MSRERSGISELLEIVFHYILFVKMIYPQQAFERRIKCNLLIWKCTDPAVCSYITNFLIFLEKFLGEEPDLEVAFIVIGKSDEVIEEFVFTIQYPKDKEDKTATFKLEELLSNIALSLCSVTCTESNCYGNTFELEVRSNCSKVTIEDIEDDLKNEKFPWNAIVDAEPEQWSKIVPLQTVISSNFKIQIYQLKKSADIIPIY